MQLLAIAHNSIAKFLVDRFGQDSTFAHTEDVYGAVVLSTFLVAYQLYFIRLALVATAKTPAYVAHKFASTSFPNDTHPEVETSKDGQTYTWHRMTALANQDSFAHNLNALADQQRESSQRPTSLRQTLRDRCVRWLRVLFRIPDHEALAQLEYAQLVDEPHTPDGGLARSLTRTPGIYDWFPKTSLRYSEGHTLGHPMSA